jgi:hypothetical protein
MLFNYIKEKIFFVKNRITYFLESFNKKQWVILISLLILSIILGS